MLEKTLESPLDCKETNQSILKEINPEYSLEGLMLGKIEDKQRRVKRDEMVGWPTLESIHDYWKNHSFDKTDLCWQSNVSAF